MPTINSLAKRYFWIFIWHSSRDTRQLRGWLRLNSMFNNPGYKYLFFKWRIVKSKLKYEVKYKYHPNQLQSFLNIHTHTKLNNKQLKFVTFHSNYPCRKRHLHIYIQQCALVCHLHHRCLFSAPIYLDINVIS